MERECGLAALCQTALNFLLLGKQPVLETLRTQVRLSDRTVAATGCGFRLEFALPDGAPTLPGEPSFEIVDAYAEIPDTKDTKDVVTFVLFVRAGRISMLEGSTTAPFWPKDLSGLFLVYNTESGIREPGSIGLAAPERLPGPSSEGPLPAEPSAGEVLD